MTKRGLFILIIVAVVGGLFVVPYATAVTYKSRLRAALTSLQAQYQQKLKDLPQSPTSQQAVAVLEPFAQAHLPQLWDLGSFAWSIPTYQQAAQLQTDANTFVSQGAAYHEAFGQLVTFYAQTNAVVAGQAGANTSSVAGWQATAKGYGDVAALRRRVVTSSLLSDVTQQEVSTFSDMANYDKQAAVALGSGDVAAETGIKTKLTQLARILHALGVTDTPQGFIGWRAHLDDEIKQLIQATRS